MLFLFLSLSRSVSELPLKDAKGGNLAIGLIVGLPKEEPNDPTRMVGEEVGRMIGDEVTERPPGPFRGIGIGMGMVSVGCVCENEPEREWGRG